jgi:VWFA-related protein
MSQRRILQEEREVSFVFFEQVLRPEFDQVFVISFDVDVELLQDLTNKLNSLEDSLRDIRIPSREDSRQIGTILFDAVYLAADEVMIGQSGRKAFILISDGVDTGSMISMDTAIESSQREDTIIYSIRFYDEQAYQGGRSRGKHPGGMGRGTGRFPGGGGGGPNRRGGGQRIPPDGKAILKKLSSETGGTLFEVSKKLALHEVFRRIEEELRNQYILGYRPQDGGSDGFRKIELRTKNKKLKVQTRSGYYPD